MGAVLCSYKSIDYEHEDKSDVSSLTTLSMSINHLEARIDEDIHVDEENKPNTIDRIHSLSVTPPQQYNVISNKTLYANELVTANETEKEMESGIKGETTKNTKPANYTQSHFGSRDTKSHIYNETSSISIALLSNRGSNSESKDAGKDTEFSNLDYMVQPVLPTTQTELDKEEIPSNKKIFGYKRLVKYLRVFRGKRKNSSVS
jgi:hypothetical protein